MWLKSPEKDMELQFLAGTFEFNGWGWGFGTSGFVSGVGEQWKTMCEYPCAAPVARKATFRIVGPDVRASEAFTLPARGRGFLLHVQPGRPGTRIAAWVVLTLGGVLAATGGVLLLSFLPKDNTSAGALGGGALFGVGLAGVFGSIPLFLKSQTNVEIEPRSSSTGSYSSSSQGDADVPD